MNLSCTIVSLGMLLIAYVSICVCEVCVYTVVCFNHRLCICICLCVQFILSVLITYLFMYLSISVYLHVDVKSTFDILIEFDEIVIRHVVSKAIQSLDNVSGYVTNVCHVHFYTSTLNASYVLAISIVTARVNLTYHVILVGTHGILKEYVLHTCDLIGNTDFSMFLILSFASFRIFLNLLASCSCLGCGVYLHHSLICIGLVKSVCFGTNSLYSNLFFTSVSKSSTIRFIIYNVL